MNKKIGRAEYNKLVDILIKNYKKGWEQEELWNDLETCLKILGVELT